MTPLITDRAIQIIYLVSTALFILSLKWMSAPSSARRGVWAGEAGMLLAICATLLHRGIVDYSWIAIALVLGSIIGVPLGRVQMTAVPQRTALSHAFGALCVALVGTAEYYLRAPHVPAFMMGVLSMEVILGSLTFTGSLMAAGKLQEVLPQRPITYKGQNIVNLSLLAVAVGLAVYLVIDPGHTRLFPLMIAIPLVFRGPHDRSDRRGGYAYGDLATQLLCGSLGGGDGFCAQQQTPHHCGCAGWLFRVHPFGNHVEGHEPFVHQCVVWRVRTGAGIGSRCAGSAHGVRSATAEEAATILVAANTVVVVPGYGMAVAQAQHKVRELYDALTQAWRGREVRHSSGVAGRMPGHMNVLLAEADIPYDKLLDMDAINSEFHADRCSFDHRR